MAPFKDSFQDRVGQAAEAKRKALEKLKSKPPVDPAVAEARAEAARQREARAEEKRAAKAEKAKADAEARAASQVKAAAEGRPRSPPRPSARRRGRAGSERLPGRRGERVISDSIYLSALAQPLAVGVNVYCHSFPPDVGASLPWGVRNCGSRFTRMCRAG